MRPVPFEAGALETWPTRDRWDPDAAGLVASMLDRWHLVAGAAFVGGEAAAVVDVLDAAGRRAVLKVGFPHPEARWEAVALDAWGAPLAPRVLRQDPWTWSMLLERVLPGDRLDERAPDTLLRVAALVQRLHAVPAPGGVDTVAQVIRVAAVAACRAVEDAPVRFGEATTGILTGLDLASDLASRDRGGAFLHGDLNPGNILESRADVPHDTGLRVVDPKPLVGAAEFDLYSLLAARSRHSSARDAGADLALLARATSCDAALVADWCVARAALESSWFGATGPPDALMRATHTLARYLELTGRG